MDAGFFIFWLILFVAAIMFIAWQVGSVSSAQQKFAEENPEVVRAAQEASRARAERRRAAMKDAPLSGIKAIRRGLRSLEEKTRPD
mgnify:CR=1 FL=1